MCDFHALISCLGFIFLFSFVFGIQESELFFIPAPWKCHNSNLTYDFSLFSGFIVDFCPSGNIGPVWGQVLRFHDDQSEGAWLLPQDDLDCWVTLSGYQAEEGTPQRLATLQWRNEYFSVVGLIENGKKCLF